MGKKNKKFKKTKHQNNLAELKSGNIANTPVRELTEDLEAKSEIIKKDATNNEEEELNRQYDYVRRDVLKLGLVISILVLIFIAIYFVSLKTSLLQTAGDWIYQISHFQIQ